MLIDRKYCIRFAKTVKNFGEGSDYFKVLVNIFQSGLLTGDNDHLKTFYIIGQGDLPPYGSNT
jgi:hypothetical protein